jgi:hypothetical protein
VLADFHVVILSHDIIRTRRCVVRHFGFWQIIIRHQNVAPVEQTKLPGSQIKENCGHVHMATSAAPKTLFKNVLGLKPLFSYQLHTFTKFP